MLSLTIVAVLVLIKLMSGSELGLNDKRIQHFFK